MNLEELDRDIINKRRIARTIRDCEYKLNILKRDGFAHERETIDLQWEEEYLTEQIKTLIINYFEAKLESALDEMEEL